jgi:SAM-dependent methyltransferase
MKSPYRNTIDSEYFNASHVEIRWEKTLSFIDKFHANLGLDIGDRTPFTDQLEAHYHCPFSNTTIDLDEGKLTGEYDVITALEIIEHLFNPLHLLKEISGVLKEGGKLYLSTPKGKPHFLWSKDHFHEMNEKSLMSLIHRAGFKLLRKDEIRIQPLSFYCRGIRPLLRLIYERHWLMELELKN